MDHSVCWHGCGCNSWKSRCDMDCSGTQADANSHKLFHRLAKLCDFIAIVIQFSLISFIFFLLSLVNLSIADAMVSTLNTTLNFVYMLYGNWPFGTLFCKISQFVASLSISASVLTLMAIAIDR